MMSKVGINNNYLIRRQNAGQYANVHDALEAKPGFWILAPGTCRLRRA